MNIIPEMFEEIFYFNSLYLSFIFYGGLIIFLWTFLGYAFIKKRYKKFSIYLESLSDDTEHERIHKINNYFDSSEKRHVLILKSLWKRYYNDYNHGTDKTIPDPLYYFNENELVSKAGRRKLVEIFPALFVSLGILGTFTGIVIGIADIDTGAGVSELQEGINSLINGMEFAFYSSILGIIMSLAYQLIDRLFFYKMIHTASDNLLLELDKSIPIKTESDLLDKMVNVQESQLNDMKSFFTDHFLPAMTSGVSESISNTIEPHLAKSNEIMDQVSQNTLDAQSDSLNQMVDHFVESLNQVTGDHIKELGSALEATVEWQGKVHAEMSGLVDELSNVAKEQAAMAENTTSLSEQMNEYTEKMSDYHEELSTTTKELNGVTSENKSLMNQMNEIYDNITTKQQEQETFFEEKVTRMNETVEKITTLGNTFTDMNEQMELTMQSLVKTSSQLGENITDNQLLSENLANQHELSNQWSVKTHELLEGISENAGLTESIQKNLNSLYNSVSSERESLDKLQEDYSKELSSSVVELSRLWNEQHAIMSDNQSQFNGLNEQLGQSMDQFAEHMHRGVQSTFEQFDVQLKNAIEYLSRGVSNINDVIESMEEDIDNVDGQITRFNEHLKAFNTAADDRVVANE